jgi:hypothetical protein
LLGGNVVERPHQALNSYSFHIDSLLYNLQTKNPAHV